MGAGIAFGVTKFLITPKYEATSSIYIVSASNNSVVNLTDLQIGAQLTATIRTDPEPPAAGGRDRKSGADQRGRRAHEHGCPQPDDHHHQHRGHPHPEGHGDQPRPAGIGRHRNELIDQACIYLPQIMETEEPNLVEEAIPPTQKSSPSTAKNVMLGGLLGACLACCVHGSTL